MSRAAAEQSAKPTFTQVTLDGTPLAVTTQPLFGKKARELTPNEIVSRALFVLIFTQWEGATEAELQKRFKKTHPYFTPFTKLTAYPVWINIFKFMFGKTVNIYQLNTIPPLMRFSAAIARPSLLLLAQDSLSVAALNADLDLVKRIVENASPTDCATMLSTVSTAATCLGRITVERTGTPLQMAIYDHDEELVAFFKEKMDPEEFERQSIVAFATALSNEKRAELERRNASALDYHQAMIEARNNDATRLCDELEAAFTAALPNEFTVDNNYVAGTTSTQLPGTIDVFINRLTDYVQKNPLHNPYILQRVYKIYSRLPSDFNRDCYFSQKVIGGVQSFLSARWLQHYAQSIYYLADNNEPPRRSFICRDSNPRIDVRHLTASCMGDDSFLGIFGTRRLEPASRVGDGWCWFQNLMSNKNNKLSELFYAASATVSLPNCVK